MLQRTQRNQMLWKTVNRWKILDKSHPAQIKVGTWTGYMLYYCGVTYKYYISYICVYSCLKYVYKYNHVLNLTYFKESFVRFI